MTKVLALAILGTVIFFPAAAMAEAPAAPHSPTFVRSTACEAAAPIRAGSVFQRRTVRATTPRKGAPAVAAAPETAPDEVDETPVLRRAVHFCAVATSGRVYRT